MRFIVLAWLGSCVATPERDLSEAQAWQRCEAAWRQSIALPERLDGGWL